MDDVDRKRNRAAYMREWNRRNLEKSRERGRNYAAAHREEAIIRATRHYEANKERRVAQVNEAKNAFKEKAIEVLGAVCMDCGFGHPIVLIFHHRDPAAKVFNISKAATSQRKYPWEVVLEEISKCDLVCRNCHEKRHSAWTDFVDGVIPTQDDPIAWRMSYRSYTLYKRAIDYLGGECIGCGEANLITLHCHHINPAMKAYPVNGKTTAAPKKLPWDELVLELDKCQLLCGNCHMIYHSHFPTTESFYIRDKNWESIPLAPNTQVRYDHA